MNFSGPIPIIRNQETENRYVGPILQLKLNSCQNNRQLHLDFIEAANSDLMAITYFCGWANV